MKYMNQARKFFPVAAALIAGGAMAAPVTPDLTDVLAQISAVVTQVVSLGLSVLSVVVVVKMFAWMKGALGR